VADDLLIRGTGLGEDVRVVRRVHVAPERRQL